MTGINGYIYLALAIIIVLLTSAVAIEYGIISSLKTDKAELEQKVTDIRQVNAGLTRDRDNCTAEKQTFEKEVVKSREDCEKDKWKWIDKDRKELTDRFAAELKRCTASWERCEKTLSSGGGHEDCDGFILRSISDFYYSDSVHP